MTQAIRPAAFSGIPRLERPAGATHGVYWLRDSAGATVYIGVGKNPRNRIVYHRSHAAWWPEDGQINISVEWFDNPTSAGEREMSLIREHQPSGNAAGVKYAAKAYSGEGTTW